MSYFSRASARSLDPFDPLVVVHADADAILAKDNLNRTIDYKAFRTGFDDIMSVSPDKHDAEAQMEWDIEDRLAYAVDDPIDPKLKEYGYIGAEDLRAWLKDFKQTHLQFWNTN
jgi:hypothetical protein